MNYKDESEILKKLGIQEFNPMQKAAHTAISSNSNTVLLSPTGTGKTLAFLFPLIKELDFSCSEIQALILVPSRELAIQIEQVIREMGSGYKVNAVYGGRAFSKDKNELSHPPAILVGTPGRVADHFRRESFSVSDIKTLVLDEFDKSLEIGFKDEMSEIIENLGGLNKRILTSATQNIEIPGFTGVQDPVVIDFLKKETPELEIRTLVAPNRDKLKTLHQLLQTTEEETGIIFCNFKDTIQEVSRFLDKHHIKHGCFHGGMEQKERERALIKFRNGSFRLLLATDLAARGIDVPQIEFIIHYQLPLRSQEFTHRNGRTARMKRSGVAYVLQWEKEELPEFISADSIWELGETSGGKFEEQPEWGTLFLSGGRKDKISKGDIAGLFLKEGGLAKEELGIIELKQDCAFVAVPSKKAAHLISTLNNSRLKKRKLRIYLV